MTDAYTALDLIEITDYRGTFALTDYANGNVAELSTPNELSSMTTGYNGNGLAAHNEPGRQRVLTLRLVKGSGQDRRLNETFELWKKRDGRFKPLKAACTKNIGHGDGSITHDTTTVFFGIPGNAPTTFINTEGDIEQLVSIFTFNFADYERTL